MDMRQYNRIMMGEHGKYLPDGLANNYIGADFGIGHDLSETPSHANPILWKKALVDEYLEQHPDKSRGSAYNGMGFLWTICFGLQKGDYVLSPDGAGGYKVGEVSGDYYYMPGTDLPHRRPMKWLGVVVPRKDMSTQLQHSVGSIGTCCNITKYAEELEQLIKGSQPAHMPQPKVPTSNATYKERSLHRLLANYLWKGDIYAKTVYHEKSAKAEDKTLKWVHPDMVGVQFHVFNTPTTQELLKASDTKQSFDLFSYELKRTIQGDHELKQAFFQALSNSNWANYGYLVAYDISEDLREEMARLNRAHGIGFIKLSPDNDEAKELFPARRNDLDYFTVDKLCKANIDFRTFIDKTVNVLNADQRIITAVRSELSTICEPPFNTDEEMQDYCNQHNIPQ